MTKDSSKVRGIFPFKLKALLFCQPFHEKSEPFFTSIQHYSPQE